MKKDVPKELRHMSRLELLEAMLMQGQELERIKSERDDLNVQLKNVRITIDDSGSVAEAVVRLSGIFESAQEAADEYVRQIRMKAEELGIPQDTMTIEFLPDAIEEALEAQEAEKARKAEEIRRRDTASLSMQEIREAATEEELREVLLEDEFDEWLDEGDSIEFI